MGNVKFNSTDLRNHLKDHGMTMVELSQKMRRCRGFISYALSRGYMSDPAYDAMCMALGVPYGTFTTPAESNTPKVYRLNLVYSDSKVLVQLMCGDEVISGAWAIIKEPTKLGFIQAISYASHMMYKFAEQSDLNKEELA